jgi:predicted nucleic-acid-binding Zn-ribbon protein
VSNIIKFTCPECQQHEEFNRIPAIIRVDGSDRFIEAKSQDQMTCLHCGYTDVMEAFTGHMQKTTLVNEDRLGVMVKTVERIHYGNWTIEADKYFQILKSKYFKSIHILGLYNLPIPGTDDAVTIMLVQTANMVPAVVEVDTFLTELRRGEWIEIDCCGNPK